MSRVEGASGARYSAHREAPRRFEPITPVGTNYVPVGAPDIAAMRQAGANRNVPTTPVTPVAPAAPPKPAAPAVRSIPLAPSSAAGFGRLSTFNRASDPGNEWDAPVSRPSPPSAVTRPPVVAAARPVPVFAPVSAVRSNTHRHPRVSSDVLLGPSCHTAFIKYPDEA